MEALMYVCIVQPAFIVFLRFPFFLLFRYFIKTFSNFGFLELQSFVRLNDE